MGIRDTPIDHQRRIFPIRVRLKRDEKTAYLLLIPILAFIGLLVYYPAIITLVRSFESIKLGVDIPPRFIGLRNYINFLMPSSEFWSSLEITLKILVMVLPMEFAIGFLGALLLNENFRGRGIVRTLAILPWMLPPIVNGFMWNWILNGDFGALNGLLYQLGIIHKYQYWLFNPISQLFWVAVAQAWTRYSFVLLVLLAALQSIPEEIYDAAKIDGASRFQSLVYITFPLLLSAFTVALVVEVVYTFQIFDLVWSITSGGGAGGQINPFTKTLMVLNYEVVFRNQGLGSGSALAYLILLVSLIFGVFFVRNLYRRVTI